MPRGLALALGSLERLLEGWNGDSTLMRKIPFFVGSALDFIVPLGEENFAFNWANVSGVFGKFAEDISDWLSKAIGQQQQRGGDQMGWNTQESNRV